MDLYGLCRCLLDGECASSVFDMHAIPEKLEPITSRPLCEPECGLLNHWCIQSCYGCHDHGAAHPLHLEVANVYRNQDGFIWNLWTGHIVKISPHEKPDEDTDSNHSISSITIIRIRVLTTVDFNDLPYSMIWAAFWSVTEPALAIANSCAPMLRPILKAACPNLFASAKAEYSTKPTSAPILSKNDSSARRVAGMDENDSEFPLTRLRQEPGYADERSLNDQSHDGRSLHAQCHPTRSIGS